MTFALPTPTSPRSRARLSAVETPHPREDRSRIEIVENPIHRHDPALGKAVEGELKRLLAEENVGEVRVRFRVCRDESDGFRFICKVENPPCVDTDVMMPWRWWSPLLETATDFAAALEDGLSVRRARLTSSRA
jgi:hypothetical protein